MTVAVTDSFSNRPEHIQETARVIGSSQPRKLVYSEVYRGKKRVKTVGEIADRIGLDRKIVLDRGRELEKAGIIRSALRDGEKAYEQIDGQLHIRPKVLAVVGNKRAVDSIVTKRSIAVVEPIFRTVAKPASSEARQKPKTRRANDVVCKIAFLMAAPAAAGAINVGKDFREAEKAVAGSAKRHKIGLKPYVAAGAEELLDALNEFAPDVIHFSGHGGTGKLLFDKQSIEDVAGQTVNFSGVKAFLAATGKLPKLLVMTACQTASEAHTLLDAVPAVIGMSGDISDLASTLFCRRFYAALAGCQTIEHAFQQAQAILRAAQLDDADLPTLVVRKGTNAAQIKLVS